MWRSVGFLMSAAVVLEAMTIVAYVVIMSGGKQRRAGSWKLLAMLHVVCTALLCAAISIIVSPSGHLCEIVTRQLVLVSRDQRLISIHRHFFTTTKIASSQAGSSMNPGYSAQSAGVWHCFWRSVSVLPPCCSLRREATSSYRAKRSSLIDGFLDTATLASGKGPPQKGELVSKGTLAACIPACSGAFDTRCWFMKVNRQSHILYRGFF